MACVGLKIGDLRHRLVLKTPTSTQDASGQVTRTFDTHSTVWGSLSPVSGREMESAHQISELVESKAVIRYNSAIKSEWRIEFHAPRDITGIPLARLLRVETQIAA